MSDSTVRQFEPIPLDGRERYRFDLEGNFYPSEDRWREDVERARDLARGVASHRGRVIESATGLLSVLKQLDDLFILLNKAWIYALLRYAVDTRDDRPYQEIQRSYSEISSEVAFADLEIMDVTDEALAGFEKEEPDLGAYRFAIEENRRKKPHTLSAQEETLLSLLDEDLTGWHRLLYQLSINRTRFRDVDLPGGGRMNVWRDRSDLLKHPERVVREKTFHWLYQDYASHNDVIVFALIQRIRTANKVARLHRFAGAPEARFFSMYLSSEEVENVLRQVEENAALYKRYQEIRKAHIASFSGLDKVEPWDLQIVPPRFERPRLDIGRASDTLQGALGFLGQEYSAELAALLDPGKGRLDLVKGEHRRSGAFAAGYYGAPWQFYSEGFDGYVDDLMTMAHEAGHAVHYKLISNAEVLPSYYRGPGYFTESFAMMNEAVTGRHLVDHARNAEERRFYLQEFLSLFMRIFDINMRFSYELATYRKVEDGSLKSADDFNRLGVELGLRYNDDFQEHPELMYNWSRTHHFWTAPLYYVNYLFSGILSTEYFRRHLRDPSFDERYVALMRNGFDDTPSALLRRFLDIDLSNPALLSGMFEYLEDLLGELDRALREGS
jgi:oligoendopeptidase F